MTSSNLYFGKYRGVVTDNNDPSRRGRIRAMVPDVLGQLPSGWAMPCVPYAGDGVGFHAIPEPDTGVWVEFEGGDPDYPIWSGTFWADGELPTDGQGAEASPELKIMRSREGLMVTMDDDRQVIRLCDSDGSNLLTIDALQGQITIRGAMKVVVEAPQIELLEHAPHPAVLGDSLLQYLNQLVATFNAHLHPGQLAAGFLPVTPAPPAPPLPPATPSLLSTRVRSG
jgi:hypothetical protein